jgi:hypothetical protein
VTTTVTPKDNSFLRRADVLYGIVGVAFLAQFGAGYAWPSFFLGWAFAEVNFEILKRLGALLLALFRDEKNPGFVLQALVAGKFALWSLVLWALVTLKWLQAVPFIFGVSALVIAGLSLGIREIKYARATRSI